MNGIVKIRRIISSFSSKMHVFINKDMEISMDGNQKMYISGLQFSVHDNDREMMYEEISELSWVIYKTQK